jgi:hypothetical protein
MFLAALTSLSGRVRQDGQHHDRVEMLSSASGCPHAEHVLELGYQRSITIRRRPYRATFALALARLSDPRRLRAMRRW